MDSEGNVAWNKTGTQGDYCLNGTYNFGGAVNYNPLVTSDANNNIITAFLCTSSLPSILIGNNTIPLSGSTQTNPFHIVVVKLNSDGVSQWSNFCYRK